MDEAASKVGPKFSRFYAQFSIVQFSKKNQAKYLRYTPDDVERLLRDAYGGVTVAQVASPEHVDDDSDDDEI